MELSTRVDGLQNDLLGFANQEGDAIGVVFEPAHEEHLTGTRLILDDVQVFLVEDGLHEVIERNSSGLYQMGVLFLIPDDVHL